MRSVTGLSSDVSVMGGGPAWPAKQRPTMSYTAPPVDVAIAAPFEPCPGHRRGAPGAAPPSAPPAPWLGEYLSAAASHGGRHHRLKAVDGLEPAAPAAPVQWPQAIKLRPCNDDAQLAMPPLPPPPPPGLIMPGRKAGAPKPENNGLRNPTRRSHKRHPVPSRNQPKELSKGVLMSRGSKNHCKGQCRPCRLCHTPEGCPNGASCNFCHFMHDDVRMLEIEVCRLKAQLRRVITKTVDADDEAHTEETASTDDTTAETSQLEFADNSQVVSDQPPCDDNVAPLYSLASEQYEFPSFVRMSF